MKYIFLLSFFILSFLLKAQEDQILQQHSGFGFKGGMNITDLTSSSYSYDPAYGFYTGALAHIHVTDHFALQPEVIYSSQGAIYSVDDHDYRINLHYFNVPVLAQIMFGHGFRIFTGPQFGLLLKARTAERADDSITVDNRYKPTDLSWSLGVSKLFRNGLGLDVRYNLGLTDVSNSSASVRNAALQAGIIYQFDK